MKKTSLKKPASGAFRRAIFLLAGSVAVCGCAGMSPQSSSELSARVLSSQAAPVYTAVMAHPTKAESSEGSLWDETGQIGEMFLSSKARRIGDIVTIKIVETSSATNKAKTSTDRESDLSAGVSSLFGAEKRYPASHPFFNPFGTVSGNMSSNFEGNGSTQRSGALTAYMTARIVDILPNGNLIIEGNREVRVNHENQIMTLAGVVRPRDISSDNIVQSTYIADAQISYSGSGIINDRQKPGWLTRAIDKVWPF